MTPSPGRPTRAYVIVSRDTGRIVSRHVSLNAARAAWRAEAFPEPGLIKGTLGTWAARHIILPVAAAETARLRAAEAAKRKPA